MKTAIILSLALLLFAGCKPNSAANENGATNGLAQPMPGDTNTANGGVGAVNQAPTMSAATNAPGNTNSTP